MQCCRTDTSVRWFTHMRTASVAFAVKVALSLFVLLISFEAAFAREWRGIVPLRSTRADVIRLLNQCFDQKEACRFTIGDEAVHILFSGGLPAEHRECANALPPETVMFIEIEPREKLKLTDLHLVKQHLQHFNPSDPAVRDFKGYRSDDGLLVSLFKDRILQIVYLPTESEAQRCSNFYVRPESFVKVVLVHVPYVYKLEAPETIQAGENLKVSAYSDVNDSRGYEWTVTGGKIVAGQYTKEVIIDTTGLEGQTIIVSAEISDVLHGAAVGSCKVRILPK